MHVRIEPNVHELRGQPVMRRRVDGSDEAREGPVAECASETKRKDYGQRSSTTGRSNQALPIGKPSATSCSYRVATWGIDL